MGSLKEEVSLQGGFWQERRNVRTETYVCGYCGDKVGVNIGYRAAPQKGSDVGIAYIRLCPTCDGPTYFARSGRQFPGALPGGPVEKVSEPLAALYDEARLSTSAGAYTAAVMVCRKMLMNIAVEKGADEGLNFFQYVQYLAGNGYLPPGGEGWVDYVRKRANEANHEIELMEKEDAEALVQFVEMLLKFIYELPGLVPNGNEGSEA